LKTAGKPEYGNLFFKWAELTGLWASSGRLLCLEPVSFQSSLFTLALRKKKCLEITRPNFFPFIKKNKRKTTSSINIF
jgi:hypothetical protein